MKLPSFKRLFKQDFDKNISEYLEPLLSSINFNIENIFEAFNKKITFKENILSSIREFTVLTDNLGNITKNVELIIDVPLMIEGLFVIKVENLTNPHEFVNSGVICLFSQNNNKITIKSIKGLLPSCLYRIKVLTIN